MPSLFPLKIADLSVALTTYTKGGSGKTSEAQGILVEAKRVEFRAAALDLDPRPPGMPISCSSPPSRSPRSLSHMPDRLDQLAIAGQPPRFACSIACIIQ